MILGLLWVLAHPAVPIQPPPVVVVSPDRKATALVETSFAMGSLFVGFRSQGESIEAFQQNGSAVSVVTPALEWAYGRYIHAGYELRFFSIEDTSSAAGQRTVIAPGVRVRLSFGLGEQWQIDGLFSGGLALWGSGANGSIMGWTRRFSAGGAYEVAPDLWAFAWLGRMVVQAGAAGQGPLSAQYAEAQPVGVEGTMLTLGVRTALE